VCIVSLTGEHVLAVRPMPADACRARAMPRATRAAHRLLDRCRGRRGEDDVRSKCRMLVRRARYRHSHRGRGASLRTTGRALDQSGVPGERFMTCCQMQVGSHRNQPPLCTLSLLEDGWENGPLGGSGAAGTLPARPGST
jgi:hypothetical protein